MRKPSVKDQSRIQLYGLVCLNPGRNSLLARHHPQILAIPTAIQGAICEIEPGLTAHNLYPSQNPDLDCPFVLYVGFYSVHTPVYAVKPLCFDAGRFAF